jgi:hypothetical protein
VNGPRAVQSSSFPFASPSSLKHEY